MSKYVKNLVADHIRRKLEGVTDALLVNVIGLGSGPSSKLRAELRAKNINLLVVKNSLAVRAMSGTPLASMFEDVTGSAAICWGSSDIVSLAKEITKLLTYVNWARPVKIEDVQAVSIVTAGRPGFLGRYAVRQLSQSNGGRQPCERWSPVRQDLSAAACSRGWTAPLS